MQSTSGEHCHLASQKKNFCDVLETHMHESVGDEDVGGEELCTYEEVCYQICNDVHEYQQMQPECADTISETTAEKVLDSMVLLGDSILEDKIGRLPEDISKLDNSCASILAKEVKVNGPEDEMLICAQFLCEDPTADCEGDDFQDTVPTYEDTGTVGIRGKSSLLPMDVCELLKSQRLGLELHYQQNKDTAKNIDFENVFLNLCQIWCWLCLCQYFLMKLCCIGCCHRIGFELGRVGKSWTKVKEMKGVKICLKTVLLKS